MKSILDIQGVKKLNRENLSKVIGNGPDDCWGYDTFYSHVFCCAINGGRVGCVSVNV